MHLMKIESVDLDDFLEVRRALEAAALRRITTPLSLASIALARDEIENMREVIGQIEIFEQADVRFHLTLISAAGNRVIHSLMLALRNAISEDLVQALSAMPNRESSMRRLVGEHEEILAAVQGGDGPKAAELIVRHIGSQRRPRNPAPGIPVTS
jgi:DNA-binding GntR family transcriptional regulator